jgi:hypothetical protein
VTSAKQELLDKLQQSQEERQNLKDASFSQVSAAYLKRVFGKGMRLESPKR